MDSDHIDNILFTDCCEEEHLCFGLDVVSVRLRKYITFQVVVWELVQFFTSSCKTWNLRFS